MARSRSRSYDDYSDNRVSRRGNSSSKVLLAVILLSIIICAVAVLCWVRILETQEMTSKVVKISDNAADTIVVKQEEQVEVENTVSFITASTSSENISLDIDDALTTMNDNNNFHTSKDYSNETSINDQVSTQAIEMKKPLIAQNLSISQQSNFSKDLVKYQEYIIKETDTLASIAQSFSLAKETLISVNQITNPSSLISGSTIQIPDRDGTLYIVRENDSLLSITAQFGLTISAKTLGDINGIKDDNLSVGHKIFIPYDHLETSGTIELEDEQHSFIMPSTGSIYRIFNQKIAHPITGEPMQLDGILIQSNENDVVVASEDGTVIDKVFNSNGSGFVKLMHNNGYVTYYDFLSDICVEITDKVQKGQSIGYFSKETTKLENPTIFFKIEQDGIALDPNSFF